MAILYKNNAVSALASSITNVATSMSVTAGQGALFPTISGSDYFYVTIISFSNPSSYEIVKVTARSTDTFTIVRAQDGTTAAAWSANDRVELRITNALLSDALGERALVGGTNATGTWPIGVTGNAGTATTLATGRTIALTGDVTGTSGTFNGSANLSFATTLANSGVTAGTYTKVTVDAKGRVTTGASLASGDLPTYTGTLTSSQVTTALGYTPLSNATSYLPLTGGTLSGALYGNVLYDNSYRAMSAVAMDMPRNIGASTNLSTDLEAGGAYSSYGSANTSWDAPFSYGGVIGLAFGSGIRAQLGFDIRHNNSDYGNLWIRTKNNLGYSTWRTVLHSGNYGSYSPSLTGSGASGTWGISVSGNAATTSQRNFSGDISATGQGRFTGWYNGNAATGQAAEIGMSAGQGYIFVYNRDTSTYGTLNVAASSANLQFSGSTINATSGALQQGGNQVLHAGNYTSYSPSLTGSGASGTWGISITGNAATATSATDSTKLPLSGGQLTGQVEFRSANQLTFSDGANTMRGFIKSLANTGTGAAGLVIATSGGESIVFKDGNADSGDINFVIRGDGVLLQGGSNTLLHAGNYSSYALPISGGTLTGNLSFSASNPSITSGGSYITIPNGAYFSGGTVYVSNQMQIRGGLANDVASELVFNGGTSGITRATGVLRVEGSAIRQGNNLARPIVNWSAGGASSGMVIFKLPGGSGNYGMVHMVFDIYEYDSPRVATVIVGGHNWSGNWHNTACNVLGYTDKQIRLGFKDGQYCVVFGTSGSSWSYGTIVLRKIHNGGFYDNVMDLGGSYTAAQTTTESFSAVTGDLRATRSPASHEVWGILYGYNSVRSNIFYDTDNTGYYCDPASSSRLSTIYCGDVYNDLGGWFRNYGATGIYNQSYGNHFYSDSGNYWNVSLGGNSNGGIRFRDNHAGTIRGYVYADTGNNIGFLNSSGSWRARVVGDDYFLVEGSSVRAPIFYDSNDTGYYADPNSTSVLNYLLTRRVKFIGEGGDSGLGTEAYAIYQEGGSWSHPYPDLRIAFHTGIKLGANASYQGIRFYTDYDMSSQVMSVNNSSDALGAANVYVNNSLQAGSSLRAPIFYDSNDTGYYTDPASTSRMNVVDSNRVTYLSKGYDAVYVGGSGLYQIGYPDTNWWHITTSGTMSLLLSCGWDWDRQVGFHYTPAASGSNGGTLRIGQMSKNSSGYNHTYTYMHMNGADRFYWDWNGVFQAYGDCRAPVFYDYNNTSYYADLSSTGDSIRAAGNITAYYSDERLKTHLGTIPNAVDKVKQLEGFYYEANATAQRLGYEPRREVGVSAQAVQRVLPEIVKPAPVSAEYLTIDYERLVPLLIEAIKEQQTQIDAAVAEIKSLKEKMQ